MTVRNLGNSWEFDLGHSQPGIGLKFVAFVQSGWESTKSFSVRKMTSEINGVHFIKKNKVKHMGILLLKSNGICKVEKWLGIC